MSESRGVNTADGRSYVRECDSGTGTIAEAEQTLNLPYGDDWKTLPVDIEGTDTFKSRDQHATEQGNDDAVSLGNFDEDVSKAPGDHLHCEHPGCSNLCPTRISPS